MHIRRFLGAFLFLVFAAPASAESYYYWYLGGYSGDSPGEVCNARGEVLGVKKSDTVWTCRKYTSDGQNILWEMNVERFGTSCQPGTEFDSATGRCKAPENPCAEKAGQDVVVSKSGTAPDSFMSLTSSGMGVPQRSGCHGGCYVEAFDMRCRYGVAGSYYCRIPSTYTGDQCSSDGAGENGSASVVSDDTGEDPTPRTNSENEPCIYSADGSRSTCTSKKSEEKEGQTCGEFNGQSICLPTAPTKDEVKIDTTVTSEPLPDDTTKTVKTDTATVTKCSGVGACSSTVTTTTTTTITYNSNGSTKSASTGCVGPGCPSSSNPDSDGDGLGDCATGNCEEEGGEFGGTEQEEVGSFGDTLGTFKGRLEASPIITAARGLSFSGGGSCSMGSNFTLFGRSMGFSDVCGWAADWFGPLHAAMLALWALVAVRTFFEA